VSRMGEGIYYSVGDIERGKQGGSKWRIIDDRLGRGGRRISVRGAGGKTELRSQKLEIDRLRETQSDRCMMFETNRMQGGVRHPGGGRAQSQGFREDCFVSEADDLRGSKAAGVRTGGKRNDHTRRAIPERDREAATGTGAVE